MVSRDRSHVYAPIFGLNASTGGANAPSVKAGSHRYLLAVFQVTGSGSANGVVEDSADDSAVAGLSPAVLVNVTPGNSHTFVIDRNHVRQFARFVWTVGSDAPTLSIIYLQVNNLEVIVASNVTLIRSGL